MRINYSNQQAFYGNLEDVLSKAISATEIRSIYERFFYEIKKETPRKLKKADMVATLVNLENSQEDMQLFVETLPKTVYRAYESLIWDDFVLVKEFQTTLGFDIVYMELGNGMWSFDTYQTKDEFPFIGIFCNHSYHAQDLKDYQASIPPAIRKWLKPYFPKPAGYDIEPLPDTAISDSSCMIFDASPTIATDVSQLADFLKRSNPSRTKKGDFTKSSIRKAESLTESGDWYPDKTKQPELDLMRHVLLLDFIEGFENELIKQLTAPEIKETVFKDIFKTLQKDDVMLAKWLLGHLRPRYRYDEEIFEPLPISRLFAIFKRLPPNAWVSLENLHSMQFYQEIDICFFEPTRYEFRGIKSGSKYYENTHSLDHGNLQTIGIDPLINGVAFLLSAFGFIQLAYKPPQNEMIKTFKHPYLTRFDGAQAVRLTDLGAYAFGLNTTFKLKNKSRKMATLRLHPEQLHVTCHDLDPITELTLKEFMEPIGPEFYRMTRASILKTCSTPKDLKTRIADFRNRIGVELPENWQQFLISLATEETALLPENKFKVFTLANRPDLRRHFMQDPLLQRLSLKVEGHRIAIEQKNVSLVYSHLRSLGYLVKST